jgi:nucleotide-binding universal stress UspA family protein
MKSIQKLLVPTDLSENSRRGLHYACSLAAESNGALTILHVANELDAWELYTDELSFLAPATRRAWPADRVLSEASLDLNHFLERHLEALKKLSCVTKRIVLGPIAEQIVTVAEEEKADLVVMSPRRYSRLRHFLRGGITDRISRMSPCPVLSVTPPLPSSAWRGTLRPAFLGWPKQRTATI